jgi:hypothetical protein
VIFGDEELPATYASRDAALFDIHGTLSWAEAHDDFEWPDLTPMGLDFNQTLRHQRQLVTCVLDKLLHDDKVKIGSTTNALDTPESNGEGEEKRDIVPCVPCASGCLKIARFLELGLMYNIGIRLLAERKRHYQREKTSDIDLVSDNTDKPALDDDEFLANTMRELIRRSGADVNSYLDGDKNSDALASILHDGLVSVWEKPVARHGVLPEQLKKRKDAWAQSSASKKCKASPELDEPRRP